MSATSVSPQALAINGGAPVREKLLPYGRQSVDERDIQAVVEVLRSDWLTTGPKVAEFEQAKAEKCAEQGCDDRDVDQKRRCGYRRRVPKPPLPR